MRLRLLVPMISLVAAAPVLAQSRAVEPVAGTPSVQGYVCAFTGKCGNVAEPTYTEAAPNIKGFKLARPIVAPPANATNLAPLSHDPVATSHGYRAPTTVATRPTYPSTHVMPAATSLQPVGAHPHADLMIAFELNSDRISPQGMASAKVFAQAMQTPELSAKRFMIAGHTDLRGTRALNMDLSARRAKAVADYLAGQGIARGRLQTRGVGPDEPLAGHTAADPMNRRVEAELAS